MCFVWEVCFVYVDWEVERVFMKFVVEIITSLKIKETPTAIFFVCVVF